MNTIDFIMTFIRLMGKPGILYQEDWIEPPAGKTAALLYYLAYQEDWVSREDVVFLLWPDTLEEKARSNLRQLLKTIKKLPYTQGLEAERKELRWKVKTDVSTLRHAIATEDWSSVITYYQGKLLESHDGNQIPEFESWLEFERESLFEFYREAVLHVCDDLEVAGKHDEAASVLASLYNADSFDEEVFQRYLELLGKAGEASKLKRVFAKHEKQLQRELGVEPAEESKAIYERWLGVASEQPNRVPTRVTINPLPLPVPATPFVGRRVESDNIVEQLQNDDCRLLTIVASGGMGKTRLALQAAQRTSVQYAHGVAFVALENVTTAEGVTAAIASSLQLGLEPSVDPTMQLLNFLKNKHLLLVLDNCEHLLEQLSIIPELLSQSETINILATSRENLNIQSEWLFELKGLTVQSEGLKSSEAVQLFQQCAQKMQLSYDSAEDMALINEICKSVEGLPLALELLGSWLRVSTLSEILDELSSNLDTLESTTRDLPARHRSIRSIYEASWSRLNPREQEALSNLAVFEGGFSKEAAKAVTGLGLPLLLALVNKSFVKRDASGRFGHHPLIWQFLREKMDGSSNAELHERHARYYAQLAADCDPPLVGKNQKAIFERINQELGNLQAAWQYAVSQHREDLLDLSYEALHDFFMYSGRSKEGVVFFKPALDALTRESLTKARILYSYGALLGWYGSREESHALTTAGFELAQQHQSKRDMGVALWYRTILDPKDDGYQAKRQASWREVHDYCEEAGETFYQARALSNNILFTEPQHYEELYQKVIALSEASQGQLALTQTYNNYAWWQLEIQGDFNKALAFNTKSMDNERFFDRSWWVARHLACRFRVLLALGQLSAAKDILDKSVVALANLDHDLIVIKWDMIEYHHSRAALALIEGRLDEAEEALAQSLLERQDQVWPKDLQMVSHVHFAQLYLAKRDYERANYHAAECVEIVSGKPHEVSDYWRDYPRAQAYHLQGSACLALGELDAAKDSAFKSLTIAIHYGFKPTMLAVMKLCAEILLSDGHGNTAKRILSMVAVNKASTFETQEAASKVLSSITRTEDAPPLSYDDALTITQNQLREVGSS